MKKNRMQTFLSLLLVLVLLVSTLPVPAFAETDAHRACDSHNWKPATCKTPKTCQTCGATEGDPDPYGHTFSQYAYCTNCYITGGVCGADAYWTYKDYTMTVYGSGAMDNCDLNTATSWRNRDIRTLVIEEGITSIGTYAFYKLTKLTNVSIPEGVTLIASSAFRECTSLEAVTLPESLEELGSWAFNECTSLTSVTIPKKVATIGIAPFLDCYNLTFIHVDPENQHFCNDSAGVLYTKDMTQLRDVPDTLTGSYVVPAGVKEIDYCAFNSAGISAVSLPEGLEILDLHAFRACVNLTEVTIPDSVTAIKNCAFYDCTNLTTVYMGEGVEIFDAYAFENTKLTWIYLPEALTTIGYEVFKNVPLKHILYGGTEEQWQAVEVDDSNSHFNPDYSSTTMHYEAQQSDIVIPTEQTDCAMEIHWFCKLCDYVHGTVIEGGFHNWNPATCTDPQTCANCGATEGEALGHDMGQWTVVNEAACNKEGSTRRDCTRCDYYETEVLPSPEHVYEAVVTAPSCTEDGYTTHTCIGCGGSYTDTPVSAYGHNMGPWEIIREATCSAEGLQRRDCSRCDHYETETIPVSNHVYEAAVTAPNCTDDGYTTHTCACGDTYTDTPVAALGHDLGDWTTEGTCQVRRCQREGCDYCVYQVVAENLNTGAQYASVAEALNAAKAGETVRMVADKDETGSPLFIQSGVTLDLGSHTLKGDFLIGLTGSMLKADRYSNKTGATYGKLMIPKEKLVMTGAVTEKVGKNDVIPVWNGVDGYVLANAHINDYDAGYGLVIDEESKKIDFAFTHVMGSSANSDFLKNGADDNALKIVIRLSWQNENGVAYQDFVYNANFVGTVAGGGYNYTFSLTGYDTLNIDVENLTVTAMFLTDSGIVSSGSVWSIRGPGA